MTPFLSTPTLLPYTTLFRSQFYLMTGADPTTGVFTKDSATVTEYFGGNQNLNRGGRVTGHAPAAVQILVSDRKSTRLNSSHTVISYAVFCLKKKKNKTRLAA